jgi:hypothetical protein
MAGFLVGDSRSARREKIISFLAEDPVVSVLLAAADFEWTVSRAIVALGRGTNVEIWKKLECSRSLDGYKKLWKEEITQGPDTSLPSVIKDWERLKKKAVELRNVLIHGKSLATTSEYAELRVEAFLEASRKIEEFAMGRGVDLHERLPVRSTHRKSKK